MGTMDRYLPSQYSECQDCEDMCWHLTCLSNNWSFQARCKEFVIDILKPYKQRQVQEMGLKKGLKLIWPLG
jgi:hypothetical protein